MKENQTQVTKGIAVIGLGFIGLPLALSFAMRGARVRGIDVLPELIEEINHGVSHHLEQYNGMTIRDILKEQLQTGQFRATTSYQEASQEVDTYIVTVGIPVANGAGNYSYIDSACSSIAKVLKKGDTVIIRSTVIPGTTEERIAPLLQEVSGLVPGEDFYLAYASERIAEGKAFEEFENMPLAMGGINEQSAQRVKEILTIVTRAEVTISNIKTVETAKVIENIQRDVNIAMVQEFAKFAQSFGIDTGELIKVANTHKRVNLLVPGPGVGGYCLPNAFYYLEPKATELGVSLNLLKRARDINDGVPNHIVTRVEKELGTLVGKKVAVLGLAMKDYSNDDRISPPIDIVKVLQERGAQVLAYDPAVVTEYSFKHSNLKDCIEQADAMLLLAMQEEFRHLNWAEVIQQMKPNAVVFDAKNVIAKDQISNHVTLLKI
ncbi:nucleotide sugar dehydrogenase [Desulfuribacillus stibiiarsenatis]|uniref:Nucleotide sugar dehydrogenase n=1 Tax=Desulfuribacillus stibiiarsenatis TaxID=1390249 RepID=A0A1E5L5Q6_9FIRM|nr:nucleotide sugar dehydrogenase [Desulfuribacillus stibiiarsenatis]OEH85465.1 nucleotide sugar dehydrogenase [Desulfuribacillus stibiiarsenatis]